MSVEKQLKAKSGYGMLVAVAVALIELPPISWTREMGGFLCVST